MSSSLAALDSAAASYVEQHNLEEHLSAAVDLAIQQKSSEPLSVIADYLSACEGEGRPHYSHPQRWPRQRPYEWSALRLSFMSM